MNSPSSIPPLSFDDDDAIDDRIRTPDPNDDPRNEEPQTREEPAYDDDDEEEEDEYAAGGRYAGDGGYSIEPPYAPFETSHESYELMMARHDAARNEAEHQRELRYLRATALQQAEQAAREAEERERATRELLAREAAARDADARAAVAERSAA